MKNKHNKLKLASVLGTFNLSEMTTVKTGDDCTFFHDEADVTTVSFVLEAAQSGQNVICILSDDTKVFILLVFWVTDLQCKVQMEHWDGSVLESQCHLCRSWSEMLAATRYARAQWL